MVLCICFKPSMFCPMIRSFKTPTRAERRVPRGFTLIELLTVIAIIGILAAILIPVVGKVRDQARRAACASNLRQCAMAAHAYAVDNDGRLFRFSPGSQAHIIEAPGQAPEGFDFFTDMRSYLEDFSVWKCPAFPAAAAIDDPINTTAHKWGTYFYFPGRSSPQFAVGPGVTPGTPFQLDQVEEPSRRVLMQDRMTEGGGYGTWMFNHPSSSKNLRTFDSSSYYSLHVYTGDRSECAGINAAFFDLSVRWIPQNELQNVGTMGSYRIYSIRPY